MFFLLSKTLDVLLSPLSWVLLLMAASVWHLRRRAGAKNGRRLLIAALAVLLFFSSDPVANTLWRSLELDAVTTMRPDVTYDAVILLGGMVEDQADEWTGRHSYNDNVERLLATFELARDGRTKVVLASGGASYKAEGAIPEARALVDQLAAWGIERDRLLTEERSLNTRDNAVESARIAREKGWTRILVVTSAFHMRRALGCFRAVGLDVDTLSVDFRSYDPARRSGSLLPRAGNFNVSSAAIREMAGWWIYRARGYARP